MGLTGLLLIICISAVISLATVVLACWWLRLPAASLGADGTQEMVVRVRDRYVPATFLASVGVPLRIEFLREDFDACSEEVFLPDFAVARHLPVGRPVTVEVRPEVPRDYLVTCRYGRYIGVIRARPRREFALRSRAQALVRHAGRLLRPRRETG